MKKIIMLAVLVLTAGICSNIYAQAPTVSTPAVSGDKDLRDTNIKTRSIDLERVDRDANKTGASANNPAKKPEAVAEDKLAAKYEEIKTDFEHIQMSQDEVIKAYQNSAKVDYAQISKSAMEINKSAMRLNSNLFPVSETPDAEKELNKNKKKDAAVEQSKTVRDLIVELDNSIGTFASSPMFQNLRLVDPKVSIKTKSDLQKIIELSSMLNTEAQKMANGGQ